ncbi:MAG: ankyrin repeat domain-containing protein [Pseudomonadota bacterium]
MDDLETAAKAGKNDDVKAILSKQPNLDCAPALGAAVLAGHRQVVRTLIDSAAESLGPSRVFVAAAFIGDSDLVDHQLNEAAEYIDYSYGLIFASRAGEVNIVHRILDKAPRDELDYEKVLAAVVALDDANLVDRLLAGSPNLFELTPGIIAAAHGGHLRIVERLLKEVPEDFDYGPILVAAARGGNLELVKRLKEKAPDDFDYTTALTTAAEGEHGDVVRYLLEADVYADRSAQLNAAAMNGLSGDVVEKLWHSAEESERMEALEQATSKRQGVFVEKFLDDILNTSNFEKVFAKVIIPLRDATVVERVIRCAPVGSNFDFDEALKEATVLGDLNGVDVLLNNSSPDHDVSVALEKAVEHKHPDIVERLIHHLLNVNSPSKNVFERVLAAVVPLENIEIIKRILNSSPPGLNYDQAMEAAAKYDLVSIFKTLSDRVSATVDSTKLLEIAASYNAKDMIKFLLNNSPTKLDRSEALSSAAEWGNVEIVTILLDGAPKDLDRTEALNVAASSGNADIVAVLLDGAPRDLDRSDALNSAVELEDADIVKLLLTDAPQNLDRSRALATAVTFDSAYIVMLLLDGAAADLDLAEGLDIAEEQNNEGLVDLLSKAKRGELIEKDGNQQLISDFKKQEALSKFIDINVDWVKKHRDILQGAKNDWAALQDLLTYAENVPDINVIDQTRIQEILDDEVHREHRLLRHIDDASGNFLGSVNPYLKDALFDYCLGPAKVHGKKLLWEEHGASRSVIDPDQEISTYMGEMFEVLQEKRPYLQFGVEVEEGILGLLEKINPKLSAELNKWLRTQYEYEEDNTIKLDELSSAVEQKTSILKRRKDLETAIRSWAIKGNWGTFLNGSTAVQAHAGISHLTTEICFPGVVKPEDGWDAEIDTGFENSKHKISHFQFHLIKQLQVNMGSIESSFFRVASTAYNKPNVKENESLDDFYKKVSGADSLRDLGKKTHLNGEKRHNLNTGNAFRRLGTVEFRCLATKYFAYTMGLDPNIVARGVLFVQQVMDVTLTQVEKQISTGMRPDDGKNSLLSPSRSMERLAEDYVQDMFRLHIIHALNHSGSERSVLLMNAIMEDKDHISR